MIAIVLGELYLPLLGGKMRKILVATKKWERYWRTAEEKKKT
jgi:hypothetical protein